MSEFHILQTRPVSSVLQEFVEIEVAVVAVSDGGAHKAFFSDDLSQSTGIDAGQAGDVACGQKLIEAFSGAPIRRLGGSGARDEPAQIDFVDGFEVFEVCADIADMWEGENDDLPGIGWIGQNFLITGDGGIEAKLADIASLSAEALA